MLDPFSLRVAFGAVAICVLGVSYFVTYRGTRSTYSGWWCLALVAFGPGTLLFLLNGTAWQVVANPLGNAVTVLGALFLLAACRSLAGRRLPERAMIGAPLLVWVPAMLDDPGRDVWPAGTLFLTVMSVVFALASWELFRVSRTYDASEGQRTEYSASLIAMCGVCGFQGVFYAGRAITFASLGPDHAYFQAVFGTSVVCLVQMVTLIIASASLTTLSHGDATKSLRERVARDPLTGVLNREGLAIVLDDLRKSEPTGLAAAVIMADLDDFKEINDEHGHDAGDEALVAFARAARETVGQDGLVVRLGGDEFLIAVQGIDPEDVIDAIGGRYPGTAPLGRMPTVSYGIADLLPGEEVLAAATRADRALYRAKADGRGRAVRQLGGGSSREAADPDQRRRIPKPRRRSGSKEP